MLEELCKRIQHCCATLRRSRNERNVGSCWFKGLTGFKLCAATPSNMQQGVHTAMTCNIQNCWELLANNVASVCMGLDSYDCYCFFDVLLTVAILVLCLSYKIYTSKVLDIFWVTWLWKQLSFSSFYQFSTGVETLIQILDNYRVISGRNGFDLTLLLINTWRQRGHMHVGWKNKLKRSSLTETKLFFMQIILRKTNSSKCLVKQNGPRLFTWLQSTSKDLFTCIYDRVYYDDMSFFEPIWVHKPFLKCITYITWEQFNRFFFFPFQGLSARDVCVSAQQIPHWILSGTLINWLRNYTLLNMYWMIECFYLPGIETAL